MSLSARELGAICRTSEATVIRFCQALGYKGLTDFRAALSHEISILERQSFWEVGSDDTSTELISKTISQGIQALQSIMLALKPEEFERAFKAIARAKTFLLFGAGGSAYLAGHIGLEFIRIGVPIRTFIDYFSQMHTAAQLGEGDVAFGISYSGVTQSVIDILTTDHRKEARHFPVQVWLAGSQDRSTPGPRSLGHRGGPGDEQNCGGRR